MSLSKYMFMKPFVPEVSFVAAKTQANGNPITPPTGTEVGDLIVVVVGTNAASITPSGWAKALADGSQCAVFYGIYAGEANFDFVSNSIASVTMASFRSAAWGGITGNGRNTSGSNDLFPSLSGFVPGSMALAVLGVYMASGNTVSYSAPSGFTEAASLKVDSGSFLDFVSAIYYKASDTDTENPSDTVTTTGSESGMVIATIRLDAV